MSLLAILILIAAVAIVGSGLALALALLARDDAGMGVEQKYGWPGDEDV